VGDGSVGPYGSDHLGSNCYVPTKVGRSLHRFTGFRTLDCHIK
jgi:hypothetical protein